MHASLLKLFVERGVIKERTEIDAIYRGLDMGRDGLVPASGTFLVLGVQRVGEEYRLTCASTIDGQRRIIAGAAIQRIDGMEPDRLARNFDLTPEGVPLRMGKRRGRKPKNRAVPANPLIREYVAPAEGVCCG